MDTILTLKGFERYNHGLQTRGRSNPSVLEPTITLGNHPLHHYNHLPLHAWRPAQQLANRGSEAINPKSNRRPNGPSPERSDESLLSATCLYTQWAGLSDNARRRKYGTRRSDLCSPTVAATAATARNKRLRGGAIGNNNAFCRIFYAHKNFKIILNTNDY